MFFQTMFSTMSQGVDYNLTLSRTENKMTVLVIPKVNGLKDTAQQNVVPFTITGTADEIDRSFFAALQQPIARAAGILTNMAEFEKQADKAASGSKSAKEEKSKTEKEDKSKEDKHDSFMKKAEELEVAGNLDGALLQLQQARLHAGDKGAKIVDEKIAALKSKMNQGSLFDVPAISQSIGLQPAVIQAPAQQTEAATQAAAPGPAPVPVPAPVQPPAATATAASPMQPVQVSAQQSSSLFSGNGWQQPVQAPPQPSVPQQPVQQGYPGFQPAQPEQPTQSAHPVQPVQQAQPSPLNPRQVYNTELYPPASGYMQGYPQQGNNSTGPMQDRYAEMQPNPAFNSGGYCYNPKDYENIPDAHLTHVGEVMNQQQSL